jgi:ATP-dependent DNA helicase RecG
LMDTAQKGRSDLRLASLRRDRDLVRLAREAAFEIVADDPTMSAHPILRDEVDLLVADDQAEFLTRS